MQLAGKIALVTGASRGIGRAIALAFAREGAQVAVCGRTAETIEQLRQELEALGKPSLGYPVDVSQAPPVEAMVANLLDKWGRIDILVNNAGITRDALLVRMTQEDWDAVLAVNLTGTFLCMRAVARTMMRQRSGRIINLASVVGLMGNPGQANYAASKAAILGLTKSVARELGGRGVTVNAIAPGFIETEMTGSLGDEVKAHWREQIPLGAFGSPSDVAAAAVFLASEAARYITGQVLQVDGGLVT